MYLNNPERCTLIMHAVSGNLAREKKYPRKDDPQMCRAASYCNKSGYNRWS